MISCAQKYEISDNNNSEINTKKCHTHLYRTSHIKKCFLQTYRDYCANTTIHGLQYLGSPRPLVHKIFWFIVIVASLYCCVQLIISTYVKWNETPVIVSFSEKTTPVWSIPFPAITICSETKHGPLLGGVTYGQFYEHLTKTMNNPNATYEPFQNITAEDLDKFRTLLQICNTQIIEEGMPLISNRSIDYLKILDQMQPDFRRYFYYCKWFSYFGECDELFTRLYTEEGVCFTFNALNVTNLYRNHTIQYKEAMRQQIYEDSNLILSRTLNWSQKYGYSRNSDLKTYPARVLGAGARAGLFIALQSFKHELDYACRGPVQGFKVLLHSPDDVPHISKQYIRIPMGREVLLAVKPNMITTSESIANYSPLRRKCYFNDERYLQFFQIYTQSNCELECLTNFTLKSCGCVKFNMPREPNTPVCNETQIYCFDHAEDELMLQEFQHGLKNGAQFHENNASECNCLPACTSLIYNAEISQGDFDLEEMLEANGDTEFLLDNAGSRMSRLSIYFKENEFLTSKRSELYGIVDFLANCGGIFGLLIGFSAMSVLEFIYYFTLHFWNVLKNL